MKSALNLIVVFLFGISGSMYSQAPLAFNYQGLAKSADGIPLEEQDISIFITLLAGGEEGFIEYEEEHFVTTSENGLFAIRIGEGFQVSGNIDNIDWGVNSYYLRTEMDPNGGENYIEMGTSQLYSVPYALYAAESGNSISGGGGEQTLQLNGTVLSIENGNSVNLSPILNGIEDDDADPSNEIQTLQLEGQILSLSGSNSITLPSGGSGGADEQTLALSGTMLSIENGNTIDLAPLINNEGSVDEFWEQIIPGSIHYYGDEISVGPEELTPALVMGSYSSDQHGYLAINNDKGDNRVIMDVEPSDNGNIVVYGPNGNSNVAVTSISSNIDNGAVAIRNEDGDTKVLSYVASNNTGQSYTRGPNGELNVYLAHISNDLDAGFIGTYNNKGGTSAYMYADPNGQGAVATLGVNGNLNVVLGTLTDRDNNGYVRVYDSGGNVEAGMYVNESGQGIVFADNIMSFHDNPEKANEKMAYSMLQGPESALYLRGTSELVNGKGRITFPKHFSHLVYSDDMTVMITPLSATSKGIAVVTKGNSSIDLEELFSGEGNYKFDWEVKASRKDIIKKSKYESIQTSAKDEFIRNAALGVKPELENDKNR